MSKIISIVHKRLLKLAVTTRTFDPSINLYRLHLPVPLVRKSMKPNYAFITESRAQNLSAWTELWKKSDLFEAKSQALYFYQYTNLNRAEFNTITDWVSDCTCWEHSDDLSKIIAAVTEEHPSWALPILQKWVKSKNAWQRRQSLVGLMEYASKRRHFLPFETYIKNIDALLTDNDYYVQKAIGWTLREVYNVYPERCQKYQYKNLAAISSIAYSAATEKLKSPDKARFNKQRKVLRRLTRN